MPDRPKSKLSAIPLKCLGIVLSDSAYRIANQTNLIIVNTFNTLRVPSCPCRFPRITVLYSVTDGHGAYEMELGIVRAETGKDVMTAKDRYAVSNPLSIGDVHVIFRNVPLPERGKYWVEVRCNGELIGQRPFFVDIAKPSRRPSDEPA
jgi:hypothetical protein